MLNVAIAKELYAEIENLPEENIGLLRQFLHFLRYRNESIDDTTYLSSVSGMMDSIKEGVNTPVSECVPLKDVWADV